jgi:hypothetical protein
VSIPPLALGAVLLLAAAQSQPPIRILNPTNPSPMPGDARMTQFDFDVRGASWRVLGVDSFPDGPVRITQVAEVKQHNPPSGWAVHIANRALLPVASLTMAAAVVDINGEVKAIQPLPAIKNLKPGQEQRRETRIRVTVIAPTDRVVFFVKDVISETGNFRAAETDVAALIKAAADRLPVP